MRDCLKLSAHSRKYTRHLLRHCVVIRHYIGAKFLIINPNQLKIETFQNIRQYDELTFLMVVNVLGNILPANYSMQI